MRRQIVAAAACLAMLVAGSETVLAKDDAIAKTGTRTKTVTLNSETRTSGYATPNNPVSKRTAKSIEKYASHPYSALIVKYAKTYGVPVDLAHAVVRFESNFNPKARGSAGEIGLMQIKPATARGMGFRGTSKALYDPETNIKFGMKYLAAAHELGGGETCGTILRYNAGHGAKRMNPVSKRYCGKVQAFLNS